MRHSLKSQEGRTLKTPRDILDCGVGKQLGLHVYSLAAFQEYYWF